MFSRLRRQRIRWSAFICVIALGFASCQWSRQLRLETNLEDTFEESFDGECMLTNAKSMMALAHDLDKVEKHIECYGSVVPKAPDVWGQARLTKHREEFEEIMAKDLTQFDVRINGAVNRADSSFLAQAVALGAAIRQPGATTPATPSVNIVAQTPSAPAAATAIISNDAATLPLIDPVGRAKIDTKSGQSTNIGLEPTIILEQKARYLNLLNQIRRTNEGDDTADAPGYSLNLMRIPVSLLPGKKTDQGWGAEVTFTAVPELGTELLPTTFRNLVINDIIDQAGFPLVRFLESDEIKELFSKDRRLVSQETYYYDEEMLLALAEGLPPEPKTGKTDKRTGQQQTRFEEKIKEYKLGSTTNARFSRALSDYPALLEHPSVTDQFKKDDALRKALEMHPEWIYVLGKHPSLVKYPVAAPRAIVDGPRISLQQLNVPNLAASKGAFGRQSFPNSQIFEIYGLEFAQEVAYSIYLTFQPEIASRGFAHLPDVQAYLQSELVAAYRFLAEPCNQQLWHHFCNNELVQMVRNRNIVGLAKKRQEFRVCFKSISQSHRSFNVERPESVPLEFSVTAALAWCILVDSALLTDRLIQDMREVSSAKGEGTMDDAWRDYFHPNPSPQARQQFNEYVRRRWPIHVFALDPATQDQNLADSLSTKRETQLALSLAFVSGEINANTLTRYTRRLEANYDTIALNRTQVGFSHGENTFGWRFYPRFQTPDTEANLTVIVRDQLIGGPNRDALLRQRRLEPGPRECVAIVLMPSFVPYVKCESVGNWFSLTNPKHKAFDLVHAMKISRSIKTLQDNGCAVSDAEQYRNGDHQRLLTKLAQLDNRMPTQCQTVQVPILNTLGGFKMFNNGTTDFAPELYGFYGAPGVMVASAESAAAAGAKKDTPAQTAGTTVTTSTTVQMGATTTTEPAKPSTPAADAAPKPSQLCEGTTLFLVGDHFSINRTKVIIGNYEAKGEMLSRQVMKICVPRTMIPVGNEVHVHVATPYGVSREIRIPVVGPKAVKVAEGFTLPPTVVTTTVESFANGKYAVYPSTVTLAWNDATGSVSKKLSLEFTFDYQGKTITAKEFVVDFDDKRGFILNNEKLIAQFLTVANGIVTTDELYLDVVKAKKITVTQVNQANATKPIEIPSPDFQLRFQKKECPKCEEPKKEIPKKAELKEGPGAVPMVPPQELPPAIPSVPKTFHSKPAEGTETPVMPVSGWTRSDVK